jgi:hypothetical protein
MAAGPQRPINCSIHVHCTPCGHVLPGWLWIPHVPDGVMLLYHLGEQHLAEIKPYLTRVETEDIGTVAIEAFERVSGHEGGVWYIREPSIQI